ncbi:hypothetical protein RCL1_005092 [Eukaryota sp. TZLM3-RCL]
MEEEKLLGQKLMWNVVVNNRPGLCGSTQNFHVLRRMKTKIATSLLTETALQLIDNSTDIQFNQNYRDPADNTLILNKITSKWIQDFRENRDIVVRTQTDKRALTDTRQKEIEKEVAIYLGRSKRQIENGEIDRQLLKNFDETHIVYNQENGKTFGILGDTELRYYLDVVS